MPKMIGLSSSGFMISARLDNKPKKKNGLFAKILLALIVACEVANNSHIFLTISKQHIQEMNRHFSGTLNHFGPMVFVANQEQD